MDYLEPWFAVDDTAWVDELNRELSPGHALHGMKLAARARRQDCDDVLYEFLDGSGRLAKVHLTYRKETDPSRPLTTVYANGGQWQQAMAADHEAFSA